MSPATTTTASVTAVSSAVYSPPSAPPSTRSGTISRPRCASGAASTATIRGTTPMVANIASWRSTIGTPPTSSSGLAPPPSRRARPPARMAADQVQVMPAGTLPE